MNAQPQKLFEYLDFLDIHHATYHHAPVFTCADELGIEIPPAATKNLFLKDDKNQLWLISALQTTKIDLKATSKMLDAKGLRFAKPELLREYLGVEPGSVTMFALINDVGKKVFPVLDQRILDNLEVSFHPLKNDATSVVTSQDLLKFITSLGYQYRVLNFSA